MTIWGDFGMGTRCEIIIYETNDEGEVTDKVELWKHWDGYPDYVVEMIKEFGKFARKLARSQIHWLGYAQDVASMLIVYDYEDRKKFVEQLKPKDREFFLEMGFLKPDVRPRGFMEDAEYVYALVIEKETEKKPKLTWKLYIYDIYELTEKVPNFDCRKLRNYKHKWEFETDAKLGMCKAEKVFEIALNKLAAIVT